ALAQDRLILEFERLGEVSAAVHHHIFNIPRVTHNHDVFRPQTERHNVAIGTGTVGQKAGWIPNKFGRMVSPGSDRRPRGVAGAGLASTFRVGSRAHTHCWPPHSSALPGVLRNVAWPPIPMRPPSARAQTPQGPPP